MESGIYRITNNVSGKVYVGSAADIYARWAAHKSSLNKGKHGNRFLQMAWKKHGIDAFAFEVLERADLADLYDREQHWLDTGGCMIGEGGYNISPSAGTCRGVKHSAEARARMSAAKKGRSARNKGVPHTEAAKAKLRARAKARLQTEEGKSHLAKMAAAANSPAATAKMSVTKTGKRHTDAARENMRDGHAAYWATATDEDRAKRGVWSGVPRPEHGAKLKGRPRADRRSLTFEQAEAIRAAKADGATYTQLSEQFGLGRASLHQIVSGKAYVRPTT